jgi:hypothetical protein
MVALRATGRGKQRPDIELSCYNWRRLMVAS